VTAIIAAVAERLRTHNKREEERIYRWTDLLLNEAERSALAARVRTELAKMPPRFVR